ncbi:hypothetical protein [Lacisediminimonas sp.]|uniref:hypothetical protein n=1 Tax=Lacisediminimonas sp. TaxID=3060582 RepID=UPI00271604D0|nr:hypothetical protein [Lacisediminimonas sp.]MDO8300170.1 hypothetical protein [Lacisediminimonas sp.]MDO9216561.1 hypothetical protein [Lacisediminimonas sp.]
MAEDPQQTILVALRPGVRQKFTDAIGDFQTSVLFCHSFEHAQHMMEVQPFHAIVATLQFDDSRMFDLLRMVRAHSVHRCKPFVAVRLTSGALPDEVVKTVMRSAIICGADAAVDYSSIEACHGVNAANQALRSTVAQCSSAAWR